MEIDKFSTTFVFLENLTPQSNFSVTINIYNLKYDFSSPNFESYYKVNEVSGKSIEADERVLEAYRNDPA